MSARAGLSIVALASLASACSFLVEFHDKDDDGSTDGGEFEAGSIRPDGAVQSDGGLVPVDGSLPVDDGGAPDVVGPFTCVGKPDGTASPRGDRYRCCNQVELDLGSSENCGGCGIACNTGAGHSCVALRGHFVCVGCNKDGGGGNGGCWSGCCTNRVGADQGVCAPEFPCGIIVPVCDDDTCKNVAGQPSGCDTDLDLAYCHY